MKNYNQFLCVKGWARDVKGAIVPYWKFKRYPIEIQTNNFKLVNRNGNGVNLILQSLHNAPKNNSKHGSNN